MAGRPGGGGGGRAAARAARGRGGGGPPKWVGMTIFLQSVADSWDFFGGKQGRLTLWRPLLPKKTGIFRGDAPGGVEWQWRNRGLGPCGGGVLQEML